MVILGGGSAGRQASGSTVKRVRWGPHREKSDLAAQQASSADSATKAQPTIEAEAPVAIPPIPEEPTSWEALIEWIRDDRVDPDAIRQWADRRLKQGNLPEPKRQLLDKLRKESDDLNEALDPIWDGKRDEKEGAVERGIDLPDLAQRIKSVNSYLASASQ